MPKIIRILRSCSKKIFCKFPTVNVSKVNFWLVICIAKNFIWTTLKMIFSIFRFFDSQILSNHNKPYITGKIIYSAFGCKRLTLMTGFVVQGHIWLSLEIPFKLYFLNKSAIQTRTCPFSVFPNVQASVYYLQIQLQLLKPWTKPSHLHSSRLFSHTLAAEKHFYRNTHSSSPTFQPLLVNRWVTMAMQTVCVFRGICGIYQLNRASSFPDP